MNMKNPPEARKEHLPETVAAYYKDSGDDLDRVRSEDVEIPRLQLLQSKHMLCESGTVKPGTVINSATQQPMIEDPNKDVIEIIPVYHWNSQIMWGDFGGEDDGPACVAQDAIHGVGDPGGECASCPHKRWVGRTRPECSACINFVTRVGDQYCTLTFSRTGIKVGRKILNILHSGGGRIFTHRISLGVQLEKSGSLSWWGWRVEPSPRDRARVDDIDVLDECDKMAEFVASMREKSSGSLKMAGSESVATSGEIADGDDVPF